VHVGAALSASGRVAGLDRDATWNLAPLGEAMIAGNGLRTADGRGGTTGILALPVRLRLLRLRCRKFIRRG
jgi:hypothetical protein